MFRPQFALLKNNTTQHTITIKSSFNTTVVMEYRRKSLRSIPTILRIWNLLLLSSFAIPTVVAWLAVLPILHRHPMPVPPSRPINRTPLGVTMDPMNHEQITRDGDNNDGTHLEQEQHKLRFGGIGRLYANDVELDQEDTINSAWESVVDRLAKATVTIVGLGGVGSWAAEAICRSGVGNLVLIDLDDICISNTNRQLHALSSTVGKMKIDEMKRRLTDINPHCNISLVHDFIMPDNVHDVLGSVRETTMLLDAIDGNPAKSALLAACVDLGIPTVTCGGAAGKMDPTKIAWSDLTVSKGDKLLGTCRKTLRKEYGFAEGIPFQEKRKLKVPRWNIDAVYSTESTKSLAANADDNASSSSLRRCDGALGTACFVTGSVGFVAASRVVERIAQNQLDIPTRGKIVANE